MTDRRWYQRDTTPKDEMRTWVAAQMMKGAFYAGIVFFGSLIFIGLLILLSRLLPEDPYAALPVMQAVGAIGLIG